MEFPVDFGIHDDDWIAKAEPEEFDAVLLPGGVINADALRIDKMAQRFVKEINLAGGPIAVICHGPWLLINAGLVPGRCSTSEFRQSLSDSHRQADG